MNHLGGRNRNHANHWPRFSLNYNPFSWLRVKPASPEEDNIAGELKSNAYNFIHERILCSCEVQTLNTPHA